MNWLALVAIAALIVIAVGCYYLHLEFVKGDYAKISAYSLALLAVFTGIMFAFALASGGALAEWIPKATNKVKAEYQRSPLASGKGVTVPTTSTYHQTEPV
jgi:hypothetical protein